MKSRPRSCPYSIIWVITIVLTVVTSDNGSGSNAMVAALLVLSPRRFKQITYLSKAGRVKVLVIVRKNIKANVNINGTLITKNSLMR